MTFKEELRKRAIINDQAKSPQALHQIQRMEADGTLDWYYVQLKGLLSDAMEDEQLTLKLLKDAMVESIYHRDGKYTLHLKEIDSTGFGIIRTVFGTIRLDKEVPSEIVKINHLYEMAQYEEPLPRRRTEALKPYFEISKQYDADMSFPQNVIKGYVDVQGQLCIASNIATWGELLISDALRQLKETEDIEGSYDGDDITFKGIE